MQLNTYTARMKTVFHLCIAFLILIAAFTTGTAIAQDEEITLTIWTFGSFFTDFYEGIIPDYKEIAPNVTIVVEEIPYVQLYDNLSGAFVAGVGAPDIVDIEQGMMSRFLKGVPGLVELSDLIAPYNDDYITAKLDLYSFEGNVYGIDHCLCPVVLYYRHDLYADAGIEMPIATWDEFIEAAGALSDEGIAALSLLDRSASDYYQFLLQTGSPGYFDIDGNVIIDSPESIALLEWYIGLIESGVAVAIPDNTTQYGLMGEGTVAGTVGADWFGSFIKDNVADTEGLWRAAPLPAFEEGGSRTSTSGGTGYAITLQSEHPEEAWKFIEFALFNEDNKLFEFEVNNLLPPVLSMLDNEMLLEPDPFFDNQSLGELFLELAPEMPHQSRHPFFNEAIQLVADAIFTAVSGDKTAEQALTDAAEELRRQIEIG